MKFDLKAFVKQSGIITIFNYLGEISVFAICYYGGICGMILYFRC